MENFRKITIEELSVHPYSAIAKEWMLVTAGDENNGYNKEISIVVEINLLNHFKSAYSDESVKRYANTTHYAGGNS